MKRAAFLLFVLACVAAIATPAEAHVPRTVNGLNLEVGWMSEPPFAGQLNAVEVILPAGAGSADGLRVQVQVGGQTSDPMKLEAAGETPGIYHAALLPTAVGGYTMRLYGTLGGKKIDESFTPKQGIEEVQGTAGIAFPNAAPSNSDLAGRITTLQDDLATAKSSATMARTIGIVGVALGALALVMGFRKR